MPGLIARENIYQRKYDQPEEGGQCPQGCKALMGAWYKAI